MIKPAVTLPASKEKTRLAFLRNFLRQRAGRIEALASDAEVVIVTCARKTLAGGVLTQPSGVRKGRVVRAETGVERELRELRQVVDALAVHTVVHDQDSRLADIADMESMTLLDANTAYQLLDNPGEPNEALSAILALR